MAQHRQVSKRYYGMAGSLHSWNACSTITGTGADRLKATRHQSRQHHGSGHLTGQQFPKADAP